MKKQILLFTLLQVLLSITFSTAQWSWIQGQNYFGVSATYGIKGVPSVNNEPPGLFEPCAWTDTSGRFWLFGGVDSYNVAYSDLWMYDPSTNEWTWVKGIGVYGTRGIPDTANCPPPRADGIATWVDKNNNLWLFGGVDRYGTSTYNDLWKYRIDSNEWTWMKGPDIPGDSGHYGAIGQADTSNNPPARAKAAATWVDSSGNLWLFGGEVSIGGGTVFNDLWKYSVDSNTWTWMKGSNLTNQQGVYGAKGVEDSLNVPGGRCIYTHWTDEEGNIWLFGGNKGLTKTFNDMWRYNPVTNNWAWMSGTKDTIPEGIFGTRCVLSSPNLPYSRTDNTACWTDSHGGFWMFGGFNGGDLNLDVRNDLWKYCDRTNEWVIVTGDTISDPPGDWGVKGISSPAYKPDGRAGSVGWRDKYYGNLFLFGGVGSSTPNAYNDLWMYAIDTTCAPCLDTITAVNPVTFPVNPVYVIYPDPAGNMLYIIGEGRGKAVIKIFNVLGEIILTQQFESRNSTFEIPQDVSHLSQGIYFLQVDSDTGSYSGRFMKE